MNQPEHQNPYQHMEKVKNHPLPIDTNITEKEYQEKRIFNELVEVPSMVKSVGNIKGKKLLDVGCGAGVHIKKYLKKGAKCRGIDISKSMIEMAKKNCPNVDFKVGSMTKLPYKDSSFDIVTASLSMDYIKNLEKGTTTTWFENFDNVSKIKVHIKHNNNDHLKIDIEIPDWRG